ncbi:MAG TPA: enediyne biosynthesis protein, partial [Micromonosporaceae bacterium]
ANNQILPVIFGVFVGVAGKHAFQAPINGRMRHFMNPSNFGIVAVLLLFPWASLVPPYHFTEYVDGALDWLIPAAIVITGTMLNAKLTKRMWLIGGWLSMFVVQAVLRGLLLDTSIPAALAPMTSVAFVLFTNYMITDPGTSPTSPLSQFAFGGGIALAYGVLTGASIVYGLFFATAAICLMRGGFLWSLHLVQQAQRRREVALATSAAVNAPAPVSLAPEREPLAA